VVGGGRLLVSRWAAGVSVVMTRQLADVDLDVRGALVSRVDAVFEVACRSRHGPGPQTLDSMAKVEGVVSQTGARVVRQHVPEDFASLPRFPEPLR
jgi:hypothetical protein